MKPAALDYLAVQTSAEALEVLERYQGEARLLAGGQSLVPLLSMRLLRPLAVVDINPVRELTGVVVTEKGVRIGALTRYAALEGAATVRSRLPLLSRAVPFVGDRQIRNRGTLGGALAHADPAGEMALCAVTLGATLHVSSRRGERDIPAEEFFQGSYTTALEPTEMVVAVTFPDGSGTVAAIAEHTRRHGDFAVVAAAVVGELDGGGRWRWVRIGLGGVADRPVHARGASALLAGTRLEPAAVREAAQRCLEEASPASDVRASAEYRRHLIPIYVERVLAELAARAGGEAG